MNRRKIALCILTSPFGFAIDRIFLKAPPKKVLQESHTVPSSIKAYADGTRDATQMLQSLIDTLTLRGKAVSVPAGTYLINPDKGITLRSNSKLILSAGTKLAARASHQGTYALIRIWDAKGVVITGGQIIGDRGKHEGASGEWGMGIDIRGSSDVSVSEISITDCWGDGVYVGKGKINRKPSSNITLKHIDSLNNRRQGLSVVSCAGLLVLGSTFSSTHGTPPQAGIDIEPNGPDIVENIVIENCTCEGNSGSGIQTYNQSSNITIRNCKILNNRRPGIMLNGVSKNVIIENNIIDGNHSYGIYVGPHVQKMKLRGNTFKNLSFGRISNIKL
jgi:parallel beta-helix repeat protein